MPIITISRQFASGGGDIAQRLADAIGALLLDRQLIQEVARRLGLPEEIVSEHDERGETLVGRLVSALRISYPDVAAPPDLLDLPSDYTEPSSRAFVQVTEQVIQEAARSDSAVIVGRGSQFVLRNHPSALHVQIYASVDQRVDAVMAEQSIARAEAEHVVRDSDAARARYARHYYHADWLAPQHYHLLLNSGLFSRQGAVDIITKAVESLS